MRLVCISDTHALHRSLKIPEGDVLFVDGEPAGRRTAKVFSSLEEAFHKRLLAIYDEIELLARRGG